MSNMLRQHTNKTQQILRGVTIPKSGSRQWERRFGGDATELTLSEPMEPRGCHLLFPTLLADSAEVALCVYCVTGFEIGVLFWTIYLGINATWLCGFAEVCEWNSLMFCRSNLQISQICISNAKCTKSTHCTYVGGCIVNRSPPLCWRPVKSSRLWCFTSCCCCCELLSCRFRYVVDFYWKLPAYRHCMCFVWMSLIFDGEVALPVVDWSCIHSLQVLVASCWMAYRTESTCSSVVQHNFQCTRVEVRLSLLLCSEAVFSCSVNIRLARLIYYMVSQSCLRSFL